MIQTAHHSPSAENTRRARAAVKPPTWSRRARALLKREIAFVGNADQLRSVSVDESSLDIESLDEPPRHGATTGKAASGLPAHLARMCEEPLLSAEQEQQIFLRMNALKYHANAARARLDPSRPCQHEVALIERRLESATRLRNRIVRANTRLAISLAKKYVTPRVTFDDLLSEALATLMIAVEKFEIDRGFRFSTYAYRAIARSLYNLVIGRSRESTPWQTGMDEAIETAAAPNANNQLDERTWSQLRRKMFSMLHRLDAREQFIVEARYALGDNPAARTFQSMADELGVSKERVRQLEQRAVGKLRKMAEGLAIDELIAIRPQH